MGETKRPSISETELDILKVLWDHGPSTVRSINDRLRQHGRRWAYTTVLTLLSRLEGKGYVSSDKSGLAHVFRPAVSRHKLLRQRLKDLAVELCEGASTPLVHALVEEHRFTPEEIDHFRRLLDQLETKPPRKQTERRRDL
jgi:predicted transcriptional regulator